ncbi:conserved hypothetical protein [Treponema primitia ZAS-2]|uniref:Uncharacterized protein n=1 Tax=Treponema primitia (strain ATCC BAA-887 / DSM 12427 / ZAS-2) TaxID=545694 RepID=F5YI00_TREPZ|nr:hypothetical protein [Treponema primitia]AEF85510.1 conserved hypothetical protein [Treponema primitia ZAS-2]
MKKLFFSRLPYAGIFLVIIALFGGAVLLLWNWLFPAIFGLPEISYIQAVGLLALARILFGGIGGSRRLAGIGLAGGGRGHNNPFREKWMQMSDEERREFIAKRHGLHDFWGGHNDHDHDKNGKKEDDTK